MKWNIISHDRGGYRVRFLPGAFGDTLNGSDGTDVKAYRDHNEETGYLGRTSNGRLQLNADAVGLAFNLSLPDTNNGRDVAALVDAGDYFGMSFGFVPDPQGFQWTEDPAGGSPIIEYFAGTLVEVSVVFDPGFPNTQVVLSSLGEPSQEVLNSLESWREETNSDKSAWTPRRHAAERTLRILKRGG